MYLPYVDYLKCYIIGILILSTYRYIPISIILNFNLVWFLYRYFVIICNLKIKSILRLYKNIHGTNIIIIGHYYFIFMLSCFVFRYLRIYVFTYLRITVSVRCVVVFVWASVTACLHVYVFSFTNDIHKQLFFFVFG